MTDFERGSCRFNIRKNSEGIAVLLDLSVKTAETHRSNIMRKLGVHCLSELVLYAVRNRIVQLAEPIPENRSADQLGIVSSGLNATPLAN